MAAPMTGKFPITTKKTAATVNSHHTDIICNIYDDKLFIIVTQLQKMGSLVLVLQENKVDDFLVTAPLISTKVILGTDEPITHVVAKNIVAEVMDAHKPVLLSLALKDQSPECIQQLKVLVRDCLHGS